MKLYKNKLILPDISLGSIKQEEEWVNIGIPKRWFMNNEFFEEIDPTIYEELNYFYDKEIHVDLTKLDYINHLLSKYNLTKTQKTKLKEWFLLWKEVNNKAIQLKIMDEKINRQIDEIIKKYLS